MFGAGLPALAIKIKSIHELVQHGVHGYIFEDHTQLAEQISDLFVDWPSKSGELERWKRNVRKFRSRSWERGEF